MRKQFIALAGAAVFTAGGFFAASMMEGAEAQSQGKAPVILIVDRAQIVANSKAGKTIPDQAEKVRADVTKELEAEKAKLEKDIADYQKNASLMADEVRAQKEQELAMRSQYGLPQKVQIMDQVFSNAVQAAQTKILLESQPILKEIVDRRGATVLLDRSAVMYAAPETDVTQEVLAALDKKLDKVDVQKISLADVEKKLKEAQAAQAQANKN